MIARFKAAFGRALPDLPKKELSWRLHFIMGALSYTLAGTDALRLIAELTPAETGQRRAAAAAPRAVPAGGTAVACSRPSDAARALDQRPAAPALTRSCAASRPFASSAYAIQKEFSDADHRLARRSARRRPRAGLRQRLRARLHRGDRRRARRGVGRAHDSRLARAGADRRRSCCSRFPLNVPALRRKLISDGVLAASARCMPPMSQTERDAIEAGTVWWDGELFSGRPDWRAAARDAATRRSPPRSSASSTTMSRSSARWSPTGRPRTSTATCRRAVWQFIKDRGFLGMSIPKEYGGLGFSAYAHSQVMTKLSTRSGTVAVTVMVPNSLGPGRAARALRHRRAEAPLPAAARQGARDPLLRADQPERRLRRGVDPRLRRRLLGRARGQARARAARHLGQALHHARARSRRCSASRSAPTTPSTSSATRKTSASPAR